MLHGKGVLISHRSSDFWVLVIKGLSQASFIKLSLNFVNILLKGMAVGMLKGPDFVAILAFFLCVYNVFFFLGVRIPK